MTALGAREPAPQHDRAIGIRRVRALYAPQETGFFPTWGRIAALSWRTTCLHDALRLPANSALNARNSDAGNESNRHSRTPVPSGADIGTCRRFDRCMGARA